MVKRGQDWTRILAAAGLESPGYEEAVRIANEKTAERKRIEAHRLEAKSKRKPRSKKK